MTAWLGQTADRVHCRGAQSDQDIPSSDHSQCLLLFDRPMGDRTKDPWIETGVTRQLLRICPVALAVVPTDGMQLGVGHNHFVPVLFQLLRDPDGMGACFHRNPSSLHILEAFSNSALCRSEAGFF